MCCKFGPQLVRPDAQVDALLSQHGRVETMWMPLIKNLAYVIYESADVAEDTRCVRPFAVHCGMAGCKWVTQWS